ncbi:MAG: hypothetical protein NVS3B8_11790 [Chitinophagaceae bacterium]
MIGKVVTGKSFRGCLKYCLNDKLEQQQKEEQIVKNRAEILLFNQCYGNEKELIQQFNEVRQLNTKLSKPVLHITLSFAPGEQLPKHQLIEIVEDCAKDMGFEKNQFVAVHHKDTKHQHLHIVANRVGFEGKTLSDSNSYKSIAAHCRRMELKHELKQVLSPRQYLSKELREIPRQDQRKDLLKENIRKSLSAAKDYREFEQKMRQLNYEVIKSRGIAFRDQQKVYTKGSEVGFSLRKIEKLLELKPELKNQLLYKEQRQSIFKEHEPANQKQQQDRPVPLHRKSGQSNQQTTKDMEPDTRLSKEISTTLSRTLEILMKPEPHEQTINPALTGEERKRRRKQKQQQSHSR